MSSNITDIYLVDTENVGFEKPDWELLGESCIVYYFVTDLMINIKVSNRLRVIPVITCGKHDALDFMIDSKLGFLMSEYGTKVNYHIISKDTGFDVICVNWSGLGYNIDRIDLLNNKSIESRFDEVICNLKLNHSKKYKALMNSYESWARSKARNRDILKGQINRCLSGVVTSNDIDVLVGTFYEMPVKDLEKFNN